MVKRLMAGICSILLVCNTVYAVEIEYPQEGYEEVFSESSDFEESLSEDEALIFSEGNDEEIIEPDEEVLDEEQVVIDEVIEESESEVFFDDLIEEYEDTPVFDDYTFEYDEDDFVDLDDSNYFDGHGEVDDSLNSVDSDEFISAKGLRKLRNSSEFTCYGDQLSGITRGLYETLCDRYYDNTQTEVQPYATYTLDEPYTFEALNYTVNDDGSVSWVGSRSGVYLDSNYEATVQYFKGLCQGAFDAFHYDFSEVFWAGTGQFSCSPSRFEYDSESGICTAYVTTVKMNMKDRYSGARNDVEGFNNAVANAVDRLRGDVNTAPTEALKIKVIHDYVVDHAEYYYPSGSNERESSASGFFNYDGQVQCEGYSRAFIVLLHQFGIEGVLGSGTMPNGNHAWAYVKLNGEWYLVDTTFDDSGKSLNWLFIGSDKTSEENRTFFTYFSTSTAQGFVQPMLASSTYHEYSNGDICDICGVNQQTGVNDSCGYGDHEFNVTLEQGGGVLYNCSKCGYQYSEENQVNLQQLVDVGTWVWSEDYSSAVYSFSVNGNKAELSDVVPTINEEVISYPTCDNEGFTLYSIQEVPYGDFVIPGGSKEVSTGYAEHNFVYNGYAKDGEVYNGTWVCTGCNSEESVEGSVSEEITNPTCIADGLNKKTITFNYNGDVQVEVIEDVIKSTGHSYEYQGMSKSGKKYIGTWKCSVCQDEENIEGVVTPEHKDATCVENGYDRDVVTFEFNGETVTVNGDETEIPLKPHEYNYTSMEKVDGKYLGEWRCSGCEDEKTVEGVVNETVVDSTCTKEGSITRKIEFSYDGNTAVDYDNETIEKKPHEYSYTGYSKQGENYVGTWKCGNCDATESVVGVVSEEREEASCVENGSLTRSISFSFNGETKVEVETEELQATGHNYIYSSIEESKGKWVCEHCNDVVLVDCEVSEERTEPTCTENGKLVKTFTATYNGDTHSVKETSVIDALGHNYEYAGFSKEGSEYKGKWKCSRCQDEQSVIGSVSENVENASCEEDGLISREITFRFGDDIKTEHDSEVIPKTGHSYGNPTWVWSDETATAKAKCKTCNKENSFTADVSREVIPSTCIDSGYTLLTATVKIGSKTYTDTKSVAYQSLTPHVRMGNVSWSWDGGNCTAKYTCKVCKSVQEVPATVVETVTNPTCKDDGLRVLTATCTINGEEFSTSKNEVIERTGNEPHIHTEIRRKEPTCEEYGKEEEVCLDCGRSLSGMVLSKLTHKYGDWVKVSDPTVFSLGVNKRTCSRCGNEENQYVPRLSPKVSLNYYSLPLKVKQSTSVLKARDIQKGDSIVSWSSSNTKIATVNSSGKVTAKKKGTCKVTVKLKSGLTASCTIKVQKTKVKTKSILVSSNTNSFVISKGKSIKLTSILNPITSLEKVKYSSSNKKVASVSKSGVVKGKKAGSCKITVKSGSKKKVIKIIVK